MHGCHLDEGWTCIPVILNSKWMKGHCMRLWSSPLMDAQVSPQFEVKTVEAKDEEFMAQIPAGPAKLISIGGWSFSRADIVFK